MEASDWTLYYSPEGYPYYYNAKTGESQWAEYDSTADNSQYQNYNNTNQAVVNGDEDDEDDDNEEDEDESDEETESGSDEDSNDEERQARVVDRILEEKFKQFLRTPEGMAAMEAEQARIAKALDKKERKRNVELEKDYVRGLQHSKKEDDGPKVVQPSLLGGIFSYVESAAGYWTTKNTAPTSSKSNKKSKSKSGDGTSSSATATGTDRQQTTHRKPHSSSSAADDEMESGAGPDDRSTRSGSNSSLSSSDHGSVSSDDSDIVAINAPFMSEFANYLTLSSLHANYVAPVNTYLTEHNVYDNTATVMQNVSTATVNVLSNVTSATLTITQQGLFYTGAGLLSAFSLLFERLNPLLLNFMRSVVDNGNTNIAASGAAGDNIEGGASDANVHSSPMSSGGLYDGAGTPRTKKAAKSSKNSKQTPPPPSSAPPAAGLGSTPRAPPSSTPRTPRGPPPGLPPGYSGGLLPTARFESPHYGTPAAGPAATPAVPSSRVSAGGPTVTWKVYEEDPSQSTDNTPVKAESSAADVSMLTDATEDVDNEEEEEGGASGAADASFISNQSAQIRYEEVYAAPSTPADGPVFHSNPYNNDENDDDDAAAAADMSFVSRQDDQSVQVQYDEVYSAPPTPADGLVFAHSNPIRQETAVKAAAAAKEEDADVSTSNVAGAEEEEVVPKSLESEFSGVDEPADVSVDLKDIALSEEDATPAVEAEE